MPDFIQDHTYFRAGLQELEAYLLSAELFWPLAGSADLPRLTIGGLMLAGKRLQARATSPAGQAELAELEGRLGIQRLRWGAVWERKARREAHARLALWRDFLGDYQDSPEIQGDAYPEQVQSRVVLHLLGKDLPTPPPEYSTLDVLDQLVRTAWLPGGFIWETDLAPAFPAAEYWFLYGKLRSSSIRSTHGRST